MPACSHDYINWAYTRLIPSGILSVAACSKAFNSPELISGDGLLSAIPVLLAAVGVELSCAVLIITLPALLSWRLTVGVFTVLLPIASYAVLSGTACNCFGQQSSAYMSLAIDVAVLLLCLFVRPKENKSAINVALAGSVAVLAAVTGVGLATYRLNAVDRSDPIAFMLADELLGKDWPLDARYDQALGELQSGKWMVFVVRSDCSHCRELIARYFSNAGFHRQGERTATFVAGGPEWPVALDSVELDFRSDARIHWAEEPFVASPAVFILENGRIVAAADGEAADEFLAECFSAAESGYVGWASQHEPKTAAGSVSMSPSGF